MPADIAVKVLNPGFLLFSNQMKFALAHMIVKMQI